MNTNAMLGITLSAVLLIQPTPLYGDDLDDAIASLRANPVEKIDADKWNKIHKASSKDATDGFMEAAANLYLSQVKWSIIDPENHGGWPFRSFLLMEEPTMSGIYDRLKSKYEKEKTPLLAYALICPALYKNDLKLVQDLRKAVAVDSLLQARLDKHLDSIWIPFTKRFRGNE